MNRDLLARSARGVAPHVTGAEDRGAFLHRLADAYHRFLSPWDSHQETLSTRERAEEELSRDPPSGPSSGAAPRAVRE